MQLKAPQNSSLFQFLQLMQLSGKENDARALKALKLIQMDESYYKSAFVQGVIKSLTDEISKYSVAGAQAFPFRFSRQEEEVAGPITAGQVIYNMQAPFLIGHDFGWFLHELNKHVLVAGGTGSGKTNLAIHGIPTEIYRFNQRHNLKGDERIGVWFIQTSRKTDDDYIARINPETIIIDTSVLRINPLYHCHYDREHVFQFNTKLVGEVFYFREIGFNKVSTALHTLNLKFNGNPFSLYELNEELKKLPKNMYEGAKRIGGLLSGKSGQVFDCLCGIPLAEKLAHDFVIFKLNEGLDFYSTQFITIYLYNHLVEYFKDQERQKLNTIICIDEAEHVLGAHADVGLIGFSTISSLLTESRASGIALISAVHEPSNVLSTLRSEPYTRISFSLSDAKDVRCMADSLSLNREEMAIIPSLPDHVCIVRFRRCPKAFMVKPLNYSEMLKNRPIANDEKALEKIKELVEQVIPREPMPEKIEIAQQENKNALPFDLEAMMLLKNACEQPFLTTVERYKQLGFSASKGNKALNALEEKRLVQKIQVKTKKGRGNISSFLELTQDGLNALGKKTQSYKGKGGLKHCYYAKRITEFYQRKGCDAKQEHLDTDVAVKTPEGLLAVEVCIHTLNIEENIKRNLDNGFKKIALVFESKDTMEKANVQPNNYLEIKLIDKFLE